MEIASDAIQVKEPILRMPVQPSLIYSGFSGIDWSFTKRAKAPAIEGIHPYPAKFIGDIPRAFIEHLAIPTGTRVLDPFCGSGTTLVEAQRAGLATVGIDLNPIACLPVSKQHHCRLILTVLSKM